MIANLHPDICRLSFKYKRWHHHCDYKPFAKKNLLVRKENKLQNDCTNNYNLILKEKVSA